MDMRSRREFAKRMMAATAAAMSGSALFGQDYTPMGGVQKGPDGVNGNPPPGPIGVGAPAGQARGAGRRRGGAGSRAPRPKPAGIFWISGTGIERQPPGTPWDLKEHTRLAMDNIKRGIESRGGTMDSFLYMQVFFSLHSDDTEPMPKGTAAATAYQQGYLDLNSVYNTYWTNGAPPRSCFALEWIPGNSLIEIVGAAYIDSSVVPPPRAPAEPPA